MTPAADAATITVDVDPNTPDPTGNTPTPEQPKNDAAPPKIDPPADEPAQPQADAGEPAALKIESPPDPAPTDAEPTSLREALEGMGLKYDNAVEEYTKLGGKLSDATYKSLAGKGYAKVVVDQIMRGLEAQATLANQVYTTTITECEKIAGGKDQLGTLLRAAPTFLDKATITRINADLAGRAEDGTPQPQRMTAAVHELMSRYSAHLNSGGAKAPVSGSAPASGAAQPFRNGSELARAEAELRSKRMDPYEDADFMARFRLTPENIRQGLN